MRRLVLGETDLKSWEVGLKQPILGALSELARPVNRGKSFTFSGFAYQLPQGSSVPCKYFELIRDHLARASFPMRIRDMLLLVKDDQSFRIQNHWRNLSKISSHSRRPKLPTAREGWECRQVLRHLFNYAALSSGKKLSWNVGSFALTVSTIDMISADGSKLDAAKFVELFKGWNKASYCPYCNAETIYSETLIERPGRPVRSDLDHFFPQWQYPYFAVSPYNLIPSCTRCNSRMKHDDDPVDYTRGNPKLKLVYPYHEDFHNLLKFEFKAISVDLLSGDAKDGDLTLTCKVPAVRGGSRAEESVRQFCLRTVYERIYRRELGNLPMRMRLAVSSYAEDMAQFLGVGQNTSLSQVSTDRVRTEILGATFDDEKIDDVRFGKLCVDLGEQLGFRWNAAKG